MIVLGIESSCDETAAALVREDGTVLADVVASQIALHAPYGGVVPELASRAHLAAIGRVIAEAVAHLPGGLADVDGIAVTEGPGLVGALLVGVQAAKAIAWATNKPIVGVNHLDGHLLAVHLVREGLASTKPEYPYVALLASGGHTALYRVDAPEEIVLLGLGYPGGPVVDRLAAEGDPNAIPFPLPMQGRKDPEFSFAGLKTAVARWVDANGVPTERSVLADVCASFQRVVTETLVRKSVAACLDEDVKRLVLTGGVAANRGLRALAAERCAKAGVELHVPPFASCTDNAAMIAYAGSFRLARTGGAAPRVYSRDPARKRGRFREDGSLIPRK